MVLFPEPMKPVSTMRSMGGCRLPADSRDFGAEKGIGPEMSQTLWYRLGPKFYCLSFLAMLSHTSSLGSS